MATMQDVATRAGVSIATVSFVVNGTKNVSPSTRDRVTSAMAELGFRNNVVARALASRRTRIMALLFPSVEHRMGPTATSFFTSAAGRASDLGYHLVLWPSEANGEDVDDLISGGLIDGVIVMEIKMEDHRIDLLLERGVPFTAIGRTRHPDALSYVDIDFETTIEDSLDYLQSLGHERVGLVTEDMEGSPMAGYAPHIRTESTFLGSAERRGMHAIVVHCGESTAGGNAAAHDLIAADPEVTAVLIMKDDSTFGLMRGLAEQGLNVPGDVSVMSIASSTAAGALHEPPLTTMDSPGRQLGRIAAESLVNQLDGPAAEPLHLLLPCTLHVAGSTAVARPRPRRR